jgi:hypothetical protein
MVQIILYINVYFHHIIRGICTEPLMFTRELNTDVKFMSFQLTSDLSFSYLFCVDVPLLLSHLVSSTSLQSPNYCAIL